MTPLKVFIVGDSKSDNASGTMTWTEYMWRAHNTLTFFQPARMAVSGWKMADAAAAVDSTLAATSVTPGVVLMNIGVNDTASGGTDPTTWKTDLAYVLDAIHTKWSSVDVYIMKIWRRGAAVQSILDNMNDVLVPEVIATRSWAHQGPDERDFLENGDDGVTYTSDGVHPNTAGKILEADEWISFLNL